MKDLYELLSLVVRLSAVSNHCTTPNSAKELTRLGYETFKTKKGNGRIGIGLKQSPNMTGGVAGKLPGSLNAQVMHSKRHEVGSELKH